MQNISKDFAASPSFYYVYSQCFLFMFQVKKKKKSNPMRLYILKGEKIYQYKQLKERIKMYLSLRGRADIVL